MPRSGTRLSAAAVIVAAGLVVAACSSGSSSSNTSSSGIAAASGASSSTPATSSSTPATSSSTPARGSSTPAKGSSATAKYAPALATVIGNSTDVVVNPAVSAAFKQADISVTAVAPATAKTTLLFPVSGGQIAGATLAGTVDHTGGLTFGHSGKNVTLTNFVINTNTKQLTATVGGQSMPIFDLSLASLTRASGPHGAVVAGNIKLTVASQAATALNSALGVSTFKDGMDFGIATLTLAYARGHR